MDSAAAAGIDCVYRRPLADPPKPPFLTDYTWNHTTLWAIKADPTITYLQSGFGPNFREQFARAASAASRARSCSTWSGRRETRR